MMSPRWGMVRSFAELLSRLEADPRAALPGACAVRLDPSESEGALHLAFAPRKVGWRELATLLVDATRPEAPERPLPELAAGQGARHPLSRPGVQLG